MVLDRRAVPRDEATKQKPRRAALRLPVAGTAELLATGGALRFTGAIHDLSATGFRLTTTPRFTLERGTQVEVLLNVRGTALRVAAGVRSNHKVRGVGFAFMNLSQRAARSIQSLMVELTEMPTA